MNRLQACKLLNIYEVTITQEQLKKKYYKACLKHHPDKKGNSNDFLKITEAYEFLKIEIDNKNDIYSNYIRKYIRFLFYFFHPIKYYLKPTLHHLINRELYYIKEYDIYIPLWHQEIIYYPICIFINVQLPSNVYIDSDNNIHVFLNECKVFELDGISFSIPYNKKIVELKGKGIPRINKNIYNVLDISDIICHITQLTSS